MVWQTLMQSGLYWSWNLILGFCFVQSKKNNFSPLDIPWDDLRFFFNLRQGDLYRADLTQKYFLIGKFLECVHGPAGIDIVRTVLKLKPNFRFLLCTVQKTTYLPLYIPQRDFRFFFTLRYGDLYRADLWLKEFFILAPFRERARFGKDKKTVFFKKMGLKKWKPKILNHR